MSIGPLSDRSAPAMHGPARCPASTPWRLGIPLGIVAAVCAVGGSMTAWGVCYEDPGELQVACAVLGIAHPPGYPGFIMLGRLVCMLPFFEPATLISGANLLSGAIAMALSYLILIRLGAHRLAALSATVIVILGDRYWCAITAPEVYAPSLCLLCLAAYSLLRWGQDGSRAWLYWGAFCFGFLVINRPPAVLMAPAFVACALMTGRRRLLTTPERLRTAGGVILAGTIPMIVCSAFLIWRDKPDTPYNYVENFHQRCYPIVDENGHDIVGLRRWFWLATAQQYTPGLTDTWHRFKVRLEYLREEFGYRALKNGSPYRGPIGFSLGLGAVLLGLIRLVRNDPPSAILTVGIILGNAAFYCMHIAYGSDTFILPALTCVAWLCGLGLTRLFASFRYRSAPVGAVIALTGICVYLSSDDTWFRSQKWLDAEPYLAKADVATMPEGSVILGIYHLVMPLQYEVLVRRKRTDMRVFAVSEFYYEPEVRKWADHPVYLLGDEWVPPGYDLVPERNLFRVVKKAAREREPIADGSSV